MYRHVAFALRRCSSALVLALLLGPTQTVLGDPVSRAAAGELVSLERPYGTASERRAQEDSAAAPKTTTNQPLEARKTKARPKYLNLRYDEDFSYLDGEPDSYEPDLFDPLKNIHLGGEWRLTLGGEFRFQLHSETNKAFGATEPANDTFQLYRFLMHADLKYRKLFRVFVQGIEAFDEERDLPLRGIDENQWDLQQLFFDLRFLGEESPWTLRVGRQELSYGVQRLVSPFEWANIRRRFDAVKVFADLDPWTIDLFYGKPVIVQRKQNDTYDEDFDFYGIYSTYSGMPRHGLDLYLFAVDDTGDPRNPNGRAGDKSTYTLGSRFHGKTSGFDYEAEVAGQWGHWAGDTVCAWSVSTLAGYTFDAAMKPRIGVGFDWASGDRNPTDGSVETFDQLFPLGHAYFGYLDLVGRKNITGPTVSLSAWPVPEKVKTAVDWHHFWLAHERDALYNAGGAAIRRDPTGRGGKEVGSEIDVTVLWKIDVHSSLLLGWSHFWDADFLQDSGASENADLLYVQYAYKF